MRRYARCPRPFAALRATLASMVAAAALGILGTLGTLGTATAHADAESSSALETPLTPPSSTATTITVDVTEAGPLPVPVAEAAWAKNTRVRFVTAPCAGPACILVRHTDAAYPDATVVSVGGWAQVHPDGSCTATVQTWLDGYPDARRAVLEHEMGHCLGLSHTSGDPRSIMQPVLSLAGSPKGPDSQDRATLNALYP